MAEKPQTPQVRSSSMVPPSRVRFIIDDSLPVQTGHLSPRPLEVTA